MCFSIPLVLSGFRGVFASPFNQFAKGSSRNKPTVHSDSLYFNTNKGFSQEKLLKFACQNKSFFEEKQRYT
jgi:hypothetical protein